MKSYNDIISQLKRVHKQCPAISNRTRFVRIMNIEDRYLHNLVLHFNLNRKYLFDGENPVKRIIKVSPSIYAQ